MCPHNILFISLLVFIAWVNAFPLHQGLGLDKLGNGYVNLNYRDVASSCTNSVKTGATCLLAGGELGANPFADLSCARAVVTTDIPPGCIACLSKYGKKVQQKAKEITKAALDKVKTTGTEVKTEVQAKVSDVGDKAKEKVSHIRDQANEKASHVKDKVFGVM
ncbi:hypothetical protein EV359DRAFT_65349 [Lentinula novae-zelandiae]|nr:hypothetical protein EV359DRAFT_65349 [Lentinula novae-zelandiae]